MVKWRSIAFANKVQGFSTPRKYVGYIVPRQASQTGKGEVNKPKPKTPAVDTVTYLKTSVHVQPLFPEPMLPESTSHLRGTGTERTKVDKFDKGIRESPRPGHCKHDVHPMGNAGASPYLPLGTKPQCIYAHLSSLTSSVTPIRVDPLTLSPQPPTFSHFHPRWPIRPLYIDIAVRPISPPIDKARNSPQLASLSCRRGREGKNPASRLSSVEAKQEMEVRTPMRAKTFNNDGRIR